MYVCMYVYIYIYIYIHKHNMFMYKYWCSGFKKGGKQQKQLLVTIKSFIQ